MMRKRHQILERVKKERTSVVGHSLQMMTCSSRNSEESVPSCCCFIDISPFTFCVLLQACFAASVCYQQHIRDLIQWYCQRGSLNRFIESPSDTVGCPVGFPQWDTDRLVRQKGLVLLGTLTGWSDRKGSRKPPLWCDTMVWALGVSKYCFCFCMYSSEHEVPDRDGFFAFST